MEPSENVVGPTKDTVLALLELLVEPVLPTMSTSSETLSPSEEESVAKQVHAVVIVYNYYHRKNHPELEFLDFVSFCKLAGALKPRLLSYMQPKRCGDCTKSNELDKELTLMGKKILDACDVSRLSLSPNVPDVGRSISKVAVFLVDKSRKNCFLLFSADTLGVWSVIEKEIIDFSSHSEVKAEEKLGSKRKRITKKPLRANASIDETCLQQQAVAAVKDACGCSRGDLKFLEKHIVCSLSKEKTATYFCIMLNQQPNQEANYVPVKDVIHSLQEPLVKHDSGRWTTTSAVEHFYLLPYANILLDWFHREQETSCEAGLKMNNQAGVIATEMISGMQMTEDPMDLLDGTVASDESSHEALWKKEDHGRGKASGVLHYIETGEQLPAYNQGTLGSSERVEDISTEMIDGMKKTEDPVKLSDRSVASNEWSHETVGKKEEYSRGKASGPLKYSETGKGLLFSNQGTCSGFLEQIEDNLPEMIGAIKTTEVPMDFSDGTVASDRSLLEAAGKEEDCSSGKRSVLLQCTETGEGLSIFNQGKCSNSLEQAEDIPTEMIGGMKKTEGPMDFSDVTVACKDSLHGAVEKKEDSSRGETFLLSQYIETGNDVPSSNLETCSGSLELVEDIPTGMIGGMKKTKETMNYSDGTIKCNETFHVAVKKKEDSWREKASSLLQYVETRKDLPISNQGTCSGSLDQAEDILTEMIGGMTEASMDLSDKVVASKKSSDQAVGKKEDYSRGKDEVADKIIKDGLSCPLTVQDRALIPFSSNYEKAVRVHEIMCSKDKVLSQTALLVLRNKRDMLSSHLRKIEDEIASCDQSIQKILNGADDSLDVKLDSILESCNNVNLRTPAVRDMMLLQSLQRGHDSALFSEKETLPESDSSMRCNPLKELDGVCQDNNWMSPTYSVSASEVLYLAKVAVKGMDFEFSITGSVHDSPDRAKESAASAMLIKLRIMAASSS